jgi:hypothetical protein
MTLVRLIPFLVTLAVTAAVVLFADAHGWSGSATTWAIAGILGGSTVIDLTVSRWWERSSRRASKARGPAHPVK